MQSISSLTMLLPCASLPKAMVQGNATIWVTSRATSSMVLSSPIASPYAVAISMMVYTPSMKKKNAMRNANAFFSALVFLTVPARSLKALTDASPPST